MTWRWPSAARLGIVLMSAAALAPVALGAQQQKVREIGIQGTILASSPAMALGGIAAGLRTSSRTRLMLTASAGTLDHAVAWRGELLAHFMLNPRRTRGAAVYGGGGVAVAGSHDAAQGYAVVLLGLEGRPGARSGWFVEAGLGGGFRAAAGWRWRR